MWAQKEDDHMPEERKLKCRFCDFTVDVVIHYKNGATKDGADVLVNHVRHAHRKLPDSLQIVPARFVHSGRSTANKIDGRGEDNFGHRVPLDKLFR